MRKIYSFKNIMVFGLSLFLLTASSVAQAEEVKYFRFMEYDSLDYDSVTKFTEEIGRDELVKFQYYYRVHFKNNIMSHAFNFHKPIVDKMPVLDGIYGFGETHNATARYDYDLKGRETLRSDIFTFKEGRICITTYKTQQKMKSCDSLKGDFVNKSISFYKDNILIKEEFYYTNQDEPDQYITYDHQSGTKKTFGPNNVFYGEGEIYSYID